MNTMKHDPKHGFKFTTNTRDNYPCYLLSSNVSFAGQMDFQTHPFDIKKTCNSQKKNKQFILSKPKQNTRGGHGIRQYMKVDETKLLAEECFGKKLTV